MDDRQPLENPLLKGMLYTGGTVFALGAIIWLANTDFDPTDTYSGLDESNSAGQFIGTSIGTAGLLLLVLGWTAAVICRQILDAPARSEDPERS